MKKTDIAERVAREAALRNKPAQAGVSTMFDAIAEALARGEVVLVVGCGRFSRNDWPVREGRKPRTGECMAIGPSAGISFKAGKPLKDSLS